MGHGRDAGPDAVRVRRFAPGDQAAVRRLVLAGLRDRWGSVDLALNDDLDDIAASYASGIVLVAEAGGRIVGTGTVRPLDGRTGEVVRMAVARDLRRRGVGTALLSALTDAAGEAGYRRLELATTADWHDAVRFYERFGFELTRIEEGRYGVDAHFALDLPPAGHAAWGTTLGAPGGTRPSEERRESTVDARTRRIAGWVIVAVGAVVAVVGGLADQLGLGGEGPDDFGGKQVAALVVGLALVVAGLVVALWWAPQARVSVPPD